MKRLLLVIALLGCVGLQADAAPQSQADLRGTHRLFIGWVDLDRDLWAPLRYANRNDWEDVVERQNLMFQAQCQTLLPDRRIKGAETASSPVAEGSDIVVKFADVKFDVKDFGIYLEIQFIDVKSGKQVGSVPYTYYRGGLVTVDNCIEGALDKVAKAIVSRVTKRPRR